MCLFMFTSISSCSSALNKRKCGTVKQPWSVLENSRYKVVMFTKQELEKANKDMKHKHFPPHFKVYVILSEFNDPDVKMDYDDKDDTDLDENLSDSDIDDLMETASV